MPKASKGRAVPLQVSMIRTRRPLTMRLLAATTALAALGVATASAQGAVKVSNYRVFEIEQTSQFKGSGSIQDLADNDNVRTSYTWKGNKKLNIAFVKNKQKARTFGARRSPSSPRRARRGARRT